MEYTPKMEAKLATPTQSLNVAATSRKVKPKTVQPKTVEGKTVESKPVEGKIIQSKLVESKPMEAKTIEVKSTKPGNSRYEGSLAQKWDNALLTGGTWAEMAKAAGITPGRLRAHAKHRTDVMKAYKLEENGDLIKLVRRPVAEAGVK